MAGDRVAGPLISVPALSCALHAAAPAPVILDVRWALGGPPGAELYATGHIPNAAFVDLDRELAGPPGEGGRHPLPLAEAFAAAMRAKGVSNDRSVVVYDTGEAVPAARAWWLLRYFGHRHVAVLDGGLTAWQAAGYALTRESPRLAPGDFQARPGAMPVLDAEAAARLATTGALLDARAAERFRGEQEPVDPVAGHIPGARNHPAACNLTGEGGFRSAAELREQFRRAGVGLETEVGAYCGSGVTAAQTVLALELAGLTGALYVGSWSDWIHDPDRPVAR